MAPRRRKKAKWGGKRPGSGRPAMFQGDRVKMTIKVTTLAKGMVDATRQALEPENGSLATDSAAIEFLIRTATNTPLDTE